MQSHEASYGLCEPRLMRDPAGTHTAGSDFIGAEIGLTPAVRLDQGLSTHSGFPLQAKRTLKSFVTHDPLSEGSSSEGLHFCVFVIAAAAFGGGA